MREQLWIFDRNKTGFFASWLMTREQANEVYQLVAMPTNFWILRVANSGYTRDLLCRLCWVDVIYHRVVFALVMIAKAETMGEVYHFCTQIMSRHFFSSVVFLGCSLRRFQGNTLGISLGMVDQRICMAIRETFHGMAPPMLKI